MATFYDIDADEIDRAGTFRESSRHGFVIDDDSAKNDSLQKKRMQVRLTEPWARSGTNLRVTRGEKLAWMLVLPGIYSVGGKP